MDGSQADVDGTLPPPSTARRRAPSRAVRPRSAVTSGRQLFYDGDANSAWSRRFHDLVVSHINDVSAGLGANALSEAQLSLCRRAAAIECELERLDAMLSRSEAVNLDAYGRAASHLRRLFETLGLQRRPRDVTPRTLGDVLRAGFDRQQQEENRKREQQQVVGDVS